ncbi:uncharacterized protein C5L36_0D03580 [Pichia kudriavzevii]|uniref:D-arabinitol 2-dehydrogenase [ribulose-forming] n=4 Tax=Pichia kudriavzevii TaxID=4909 RepID=A0A1V2LF78_PICKU|nr:uncharacterized protein C5L36_0D03580 [Pichia kudriavzevii]AWU77624.1 hypothetical protein C5L36_0D03580 [Pichia kudriavzevii]ONH70577.1 D-arabinitol 2-dehydrogenase [ribulose-forming] [Pichia kudriavzevii]ONH74676.1 D-arabinitol 2-dehydrogenase [ribulose-forming] [Pichia kudriavzevii]
MSVPTFRLTNELTVVTGASGGIAHALVETLLVYGAPLALVDRNMEALHRTRDAMVRFCVEEANIKEEDVPKMECFTCNIGDAGEVETLFGEIYNVFQRYPLHMVNCAGYCENFAAVDYPAQNAHDLMGVNLLGAFYLSQCFAKPLIEHNISGGSIVLIASMSGKIVNTPQNQCIYNASKAGVIHLAKSLAAEWGALMHPIRVNTLSPGYTATPLTRNVVSGDASLAAEWTRRVPLGRMAHPREMAGAVLFLLANDASSYTTGEDVLVDGGYSVW